MRYLCSQDYLVCLGYRTSLNKHNIHCFDPHGLLAVSKISNSHKCLHNSHENLVLAEFQPIRHRDHDSQEKSHRSGWFWFPAQLITSNVTKGKSNISEPQSLHLQSCCCLVTKLYLTLLWPMTIAHQTLLSMGFPRQEYWSELSFHSSRDLLEPGIEPTSPALQVDSVLLSHLGSPL